MGILSKISNSNRSSGVNTGWLWQLFITYGHLSKLTVFLKTNAINTKLYVIGGLVFTLVLVFISIFFRGFYVEKKVNFSSNFYTSKYFYWHQTVSSTYWSNRSLFCCFISKLLFQWLWYQIYFIDFDVVMVYIFVCRSEGCSQIKSEPVYGMSNQTRSGQKSNIRCSFTC